MIRPQKRRFSVSDSLVITLITVSLIIATSSICLVFFSDLKDDLVFFITYLVGMGGAVLLTYLAYKKLFSQPLWNFKLLQTRAIIALFPLVLVFQFGVTTPLISLIPISASTEMQLLKTFSNPSIFTFLSIVVLAPILEELLFRGIILRGLLARMSAPKAIGLSSFLFGFVHLNPWQFVSAFFMGLLLGWLFERQKSVANCVLVHFVANCAGYITYVFNNSEQASLFISDQYVRKSFQFLPLSLIIAASLFYLLFRLTTKGSQTPTLVN